MAAKKMVLTVSREHGSGGREIAQEAAKQLKLPFVDSQIIKLATQKLGIPPEELVQFDEKVAPRLADLSAAVTETHQSPNFNLSQALFPDQEALGRQLQKSRPAVALAGDQDERRRAAIHKGYHELVDALIKELAAKGGSVIMGRGANFILGRRPQTVHVHVHAPVHFREQRLMNLQKISREEADRQIHETDAQRSEYIRRYHKAEWLDPNYYNLIINTADISLPAAVSTLVQLVKSVAAQKPDEDIHTSYERFEQESYTVKEAAQLLWTSPDLILQAIYRGELKVPVVDKRVNRISRQALVEYLHRCRN